MRYHGYSRDSCWRAESSYPRARALFTSIPFWGHGTSLSVVVKGVGGETEGGQRADTMTTPCTEETRIIKYPAPPTDMVHYYAQICHILSRKEITIILLTTCPWHFWLLACILDTHSYDYLADTFHLPSQLPSVRAQLSGQIL